MQRPSADQGRPPSYSGIFRVEATPVPPARRGPRQRWLLAIVLFLATCASTFLVGGPVYAGAVMFILLSHELGHYLAARHYQVPASLPYFVPFPISLLGTLGAVIVMRPRAAGRRAFFDIAAAGPVAGLVPTLVACIVGIRMSEVRPAAVSEEYLVELGDPLIFSWISRLTFGPLPDDVTLLLHPIAFAGWVGLLITSLNLMPIGQLDGGHILYTLLGKRAHVASVGLLGFAGLVVAVDGVREIVAEGAGYWPWFLMVLLLFLLGPRHPPTANDYEDLGKGRQVLGWALLAFIVIGFTPRPIIV